MPILAKPSSSIIGIFVGDPIHRRLLEGASTHLGLTPEVLKANDLQRAESLRYELLIADEPQAKAIVARLRGVSGIDDPYRPAVIAVVTNQFSIRHSPDMEVYDGVLPMPQLPDALAAQLSVALYSHRAFARRYEGQVEELQLNRSIFGSIASGVSVADAQKVDLPLLYVNPSFEAMTGYTLEESLGKNCRFLQGTHRDQPALTLIREAVRDGKPTVAILRNYRKDGSGFWNELALSPIHSKDGKLTHFIGIQTDVTQRVDFELALRESEKLAVTGRLAAVIAHEINNPLEAITNLTFLAQTAKTFKLSRKYLRDLDDQLRRIKLITAQALRFSKQSSKPDAINAAALLDSVIGIQHARMKVAGVQVERKDEANQSFVGMESEIRQVLNNLITNATDAMRRRTGALRVRSRKATDWATRRQGIVFTIADQGDGITPEARENLFKPFHTTKGNQGTGLGMWVSKGIVDRHHGRITFKSKHGVGTVFRVFVPHQAVVPDAPPATETVSSAVDTTSGTT